MKFFIFLLGIPFLTCCASNKSSKSENAINDGLGESEYLSAYNIDSTHAVFYTVDSANYRSKVRFLIYNLNDSTLVKDGTVDNGMISWYSESTVRIVEKIGIAAGNESNLRISFYNVRSGEESTESTPRTIQE